MSCESEHRLIIEGGIVLWFRSRLRNVHLLALGGVIVNVWHSVLRGVQVPGALGAIGVYIGVRVSLMGPRYVIRMDCRRRQSRN